jgi:two-component system response regulator HydG
MEEGRFREDLFYRLHVISIHLPALRERRDDVPLLVQHFLEKYGEENERKGIEVAPEALDLLMEYDWPGNVRELENCMERAVALCRFDEITVDDLPSKVQEHQSSKIVITTESPGELITLDEMERRYVRQVLNAVGGNKTHAARILGIDRRSLYRRLEEPRHESKPSEPPATMSHPRTPVPPPHASNGHVASSSSNPGAPAGHHGEVE